MIVVFAAAAIVFTGSLAAQYGDIFVPYAVGTAFKCNAQFIDCDVNTFLNDKNSISGRYYYKNKVWYFRSEVPYLTGGIISVCPPQWHRGPRSDDVEYCKSVIAGPIVKIYHSWKVNYVHDWLQQVLTLDFENRTYDFVERGFRSEHITLFRGTGVLEERGRSRTSTKPPVDPPDMSVFGEFERDPPPPN